MRRVDRLLLKVQEAEPPELKSDFCKTRRDPEREKEHFTPQPRFRKIGNAPALYLVFLPIGRKSRGAKNRNFLLREKNILLRDRNTPLRKRNILLRSENP